MDHVTGLSLGRIAVGAGALADPRLAGRLFHLDPQLNPQLPFVARLFASRELALGVATLLASGPARRNLVAIGILVDAADAATGYLGVREGLITPKAGRALGIPALTAVAAGIAGLQHLRRVPA